MSEPAEPKLLVTIAAKVDEDLARRIRKIAKRSGMKDGQLVRLILERMDALLSENWKDFVNIPTFLEHVFFDAHQLGLFLKQHAGFERDERS